MIQKTVQVKRWTKVPKIYHFQFHESNWNERVHFLPGTSNSGSRWLEIVRALEIFLTFRWWF